MSDARVRVTVISNYICPWCYVGMARIERLQRNFALNVQWQPFEIHPEIPPEGKPMGGVAAAYYERFRPLAADAGLPFELPERVPNSHRALEAAEFAREQGAFDPFHHALFLAYFTHGRDISDLDVLSELGASCGVDADELREALESRRYAALVDERTDESRQQGYTGTPTFIFEDGERRFPITGAQDYEVFESVARRMGATELAPTVFMTS
ncbi:MAG: DsbA family oxidoreductase [Dehalococcoidia bacterium]